MKFKKLFKLSAFLTLASPLALAASCGGGGTATVSMADKVYFVTDGGDIHDKSFNESVWHGFNDILGRDTNSLKNVYQPASSTEIPNNYSAIKDKGGKLIVCPGFLHEDYIKAAAPVNKGMNFLYIDGTVKEDNVASVVFDMKAPAFIMGVLAAEKAVELANATGGDKAARIGFYGGLKIPPVTDFTVPFKAGAEYYKAHNKDKVTVTVEDGGFAKGFKFGKDTQSYTIASKLMKGENGDHAEIGLAVGGPQYNDLIQAIKDQSLSGKVQIIGVDTNLKTKIDETYKDWVFGSITKGLQIATKNVGREAVLDIVLGTKNVLGKVHSGTLDNEEVGLVVGDNVGKIANDYLITTTLLAKLVDDPNAATPTNLTAAEVLAAAKAFNYDFETLKPV